MTQTQISGRKWTLDGLIVIFLGKEVTGGYLNLTFPENPFCLRLNASLTEKAKMHTESSVFINGNNFVKPGFSYFVYTVMISRYW